MKILKDNIYKTAMKKIEEKGEKEGKREEEENKKGDKKQKN